MTAILTPDLVHQIRTATLPDTEWARRLDVPVRTVRDARTGNTWPRVATPPDNRAREGNGGLKPIAKPAHEH